MAGQDIFKLVEEINKNKDTDKIDDIYNLLDELKKEEVSSSVHKNAESSRVKKSSLADFKKVKRPLLPNAVSEYDSYSECVLNYISDVNYGDNNEDYIRGHRDALSKYYVAIKNNHNDLYVEKGRVSDELANVKSANLNDLYTRGYYDGLDYVNKALIRGRESMSKKIYEKLLKELN